MSRSEYIDHIARISEGKDSLKMVDVIISRGLQLDGVTTTDVWATDTVRAELPEVLIAKERIEEKLWQMYRIEVDHLCARNRDGTKRTYEQMFYHIPNRRSQTVQVEREREAKQVPRATRRASRTHSAWENWPAEPDVGRVADGIPNRVDRLKCLGNAVVPQQFYPIFEAIAEIEKRGKMNEQQSAKTRGCQEQQASG